MMQNLLASTGIKAKIDATP